MIQEIFHILLWITTIILVVSGFDDLFIDVTYWINRRKYKKSLPKFSDMDSKPEKPIVIMIGAWREYKVIGRTLTLALNKLKYSNYRILVGVYPNDLKTVKVVRDIAKKDKRVILCLNVSDGPTTKADNLNNLYSCLKEYERTHGLFEVVLIHDSEDFIHPLSLKLFNYFISYKGYYAIQIPVIPIKSKFGRFFHRTYCDSFAELHSKDLVVRQTLGSFVPFAGTGMGFNRNAFLYLESQAEKYTPHQSNIKKETQKKDVLPTYKPIEELINEMDKEQEKSKLNDKIEVDLRYESGNSNSSVKFPIKRKVLVKQISLFLIAAVLIGLIIINNNNVSSRSMEEIKHENIKAETVATNSENNLEEQTKEFAKISSGYSDFNLKIIYLKEINGTYSIQESSWNEKSKANQRVALVSKTLNDNNVNISEFNSEGITFYRVVLKGFESLESAKVKAQLIRELIKY
ncbi:MAG TPA: glycosyltransferase [Ignavibacteria bacterium]